MQSVSSWPRYWLVDPLDGTKEFVSRNGEFTVNIALIEDHRPVMGVVHIPVTDTTYTGIPGAGRMEGNSVTGHAHPSPCAAKRKPPLRVRRQPVAWQPRAGDRTRSAGPPRTAAGWQLDQALPGGRRLCGSVSAAGPYLRVGHRCRPGRAWRLPVARSCASRTVRRCATTTSLNC